MADWLFLLQVFCLKKVIFDPLPAAPGAVVTLVQTLVEVAELSLESPAEKTQASLQSDGVRLLAPPQDVADGVQDLLPDVRTRRGRSRGRDSTRGKSLRRNSTRRRGVFESYLELSLET